MILEKTVSLNQNRGWDGGIKMEGNKGGGKSLTGAHSRAKQASSRIKDRLMQLRGDLGLPEGKKEGSEEKTRQE